MKNPENREMMGELYRIMEKYETPPDGNDKQLAFFDSLLADVQVFYRKWWQEKQNPFAERMAHALYEALSDQCKSDN